ncbi:MAG: ribonuclease Z [Myxococcales bacterium]|nr:ribonuclease Z [Myxococcales bacterium]
MSELRVVFLGTASGKPTPSRNVSAIALLLDGVLTLFDCGEGTQTQFIRAGVRASGLEAVCISHFHGDHINGLPGFLSTLALNQHDGEVAVVGPEGLGTYFDTLRKLSIFVPRYPLKPFEIQQPGAVYRGENFRITTERLNHRIETWGFRFEEFERPGRFDLDAARALDIPPGPVYGRLQRGETVTLSDGRTIHPESVVGPSRPGRCVVYIPDTRPCDAAIRLAAGCDLLIHEGTYNAGLEAQAHSRGHSTVADAARVAAQAGVKRLAITHISPKHTDLRELERAAKEIFPETRVMRDFDEILVPLPE